MSVYQTCPKCHYCVDLKDRPSDHSLRRIGSTCPKCEKKNMNSVMLHKCPFCNCYILAHGFYRHVRKYCPKNKNMTPFLVSKNSVKIRFKKPPTEDDLESASIMAQGVPIDSFVCKHSFRLIAGAPDPDRDQFASNPIHIEKRKYFKPESANIIAKDQSRLALEKIFSEPSKHLSTFAKSVVRRENTIFESSANPSYTIGSAYYTPLLNSIPPNVDHKSIPNTIIQPSEKTKSIPSQQSIILSQGSVDRFTSNVSAPVYETKPIMKESVHNGTSNTSKNLNSTAICLNNYNTPNGVPSQNAVNQPFVYSFSTNPLDQYFSLSEFNCKEETLYFDTMDSNVEFTPSNLLPLLSNEDWINHFLSFDKQAYNHSLVDVNYF